MRVSTPTVVDTQPVETAKKSTEVLPTTPEETSLPPSLRLEAKQLPLIVDLLGAKPYYDTFDVKALSEKIDTYVNSEISRRELKDTEESYKSVIDEVTKKLNLPEDATVYSKLEKLVEYLRINQKMLDAITEKQELLTADPMSLSSAQLKKRLELNGS